MLLKDFQAITTKIAQNLSNQALVTELLTTLNEDYSQTSTSAENFTKQIDEYKGQIDSLQKTNMNLFLRVGNQVPDKVIDKPIDEKMTYEDLLGKMGDE